MRKIVAGLFLSLDGVYEAPDRWSFPYFDAEMSAAMQAQMDASDAMLLGRMTYQDCAGYWPNRSGDDEPMAAYMNDTAKFVVSSTLDRLEWQNSTLIDGGKVVEQLTALKRRPGKEIAIHGSGPLVRSLLAAGLLDELRLLVHPIVVGRGKRLFPDGVAQQGLELVESETFGTGVVYLTYRPAGSSGGAILPAGG
jgi:dihydrofolate reductase